MGPTKVLLLDPFRFGLRVVLTVAPLSFESRLQSNRGGFLAVVSSDLRKELWTWVHWSPVETRRSTACFLQRFWPATTYVTRIVVRAKSKNDDNTHTCRFLSCLFFVLLHSKATHPYQELSTRP